MVLARKFNIFKDGKRVKQWWIMIHFPSLPSFLQLQPHQTSLDSCSAVVSPPLGRALGPLHLFLKTFNNPVHLANFHHPYLSLSITLSDSRLN